MNSHPTKKKKTLEAFCLISNRSKHADGGQMAGSRTVAVERKTLTAIETTVDAMGTNWIIFCSVSREGMKACSVVRSSRGAFAVAEYSEETASWRVCSEHRAFYLLSWILELLNSVAKSLLTVYKTLLPRQVQKAPVSLFSPPPSQSRMFVVTALELD